MELENITQKIITQYDSAGIMGFASDLGMVNGLAVVAAATIALVTGATVEAVKTTLAWGQELHTTTLELGDTTDQAAGLQLATDAVGISIDTVTSKMMMLEKGLMTNKDKIGATGTELTNLGINWHNVNGTLMDSPQLLQSVADWFANTTDAVARNNAETLIFGRGSAQLDDLLENLAGNGMQKYIDQAKAMGLNLTPQMTENIKNLNQNMNILQDQVKGIAVIFGQAFVPALQASVQWIGNLVTQMTPAVQQFGGFLALLLGGSANGPLAPTMGGGTAGGRPASYSAQQANYDFWASQSHKVGATNPYATGGSPGLGPNSEFAQGAVPVAGNALTPFETDIMGVVDEVKSQLPIIGGWFNTYGPVFGGVLNRLVTLFPTPAVPLPAGEGYGSGPGGKVYNSDLNKPVAQLTGDDWQKLFMGLADKMGVPQVTVAQWNVTNGKIQTSLDNSSQAQRDLKKSIDAFNNTSLTLPRTIRDAIITGLAGTGK